MTFSHPPVMNSLAPGTLALDTSPLDPLASEVHGGPHAPSADRSASGRGR
jgi:hypothetical protein